MSIRSVADIAQAFDEGRSHYQTFLKAPSTMTAGLLADASMAGQLPSAQYYAGNDLTFTPFPNQPHKIHYAGPNVNSLGMKKYLRTIEIIKAGGGTGFSAGSTFFINDIVGFYPNVSCETTESQVMDNTITFPRYADGVGLKFYYVQVFGNSAGQSITVTYTDTDNIQRAAVAVHTAFGGYGVIQNGYMFFGSSAKPFFDLGANVRGVKSIDSVVVGTGGSGLGAIVVVKPLAQTYYQDSSGYAPHEKDLFTSQQQMPEILDGACLQMVITSSTTSNGNDRLFGGLEFIWG